MKILLLNDIAGLKEEFQRFKDDKSLAQKVEKSLDAFRYNDKLTQKVEKILDAFRNNDKLDVQVRTLTDKTVTGYGKSDWS